MSPEALQAYASVAGLLLAIVGLPVLFVQIRALQRSVQAGVHAAMYAQAADFRSHLVDHPQLRKYFFDAVEIASDHEEFERVVTLAELFLNYLEHIAVMHDSFGRPNQPALDRFVRHALQTSPVLRQRLTENRAAYSNALWRFIPRSGGG